MRPTSASSCVIYPRHSPSVTTLRNFSHRSAEDTLPADLCQALPELPQVVHPSPVPARRGFGQGTTPLIALFGFTD